MSMFQVRKLKRLSDSFKVNGLVSSRAETLTYLKEIQVNPSMVYLNAFL